MQNQSNAHKKLAGNALSGMVATIIYMVSRILLTPYILHFLSLAEFGLWSLSFIILSYAGMGGFGVNSTYIRYAARYLAEGKEGEISKLLSTGIAYMLSFSLLFCSLLYLIMPVILQQFHVEPSQQELASTIFIGTAIVFSLELTLGGLAFIINGMHEFAKEKIISTVAGIFEILFILLFLALGSGVKGLLYAFALRLIMASALCWKVARTLLPSLTISWKLVSREHFRHFIGFGGKVQVLGIIGIFLTAIDRMFITAISGLASGGMFELGRKFPSTAGSIANSAFGPFLSTAAHLDGSWSAETDNTLAKRIKTYIKIVVVAVLFAIFPLCFLQVFQSYLPLSPLFCALVIATLFFALFFLLQHEQKNNNFLDSHELKELYLNGIRFTNIISSTLFIFLVSMAHPLINGWVGSKYSEAENIMIFLSIGYAVQQCTGPINMIFRGINRTGKELEYMLVQLVLMVIWIPAGTIAYSLSGAAAAIALSSITSTLFLFWRSGYTFQVNMKEFVVRSLLPALVPIIPGSFFYAVTLFFPLTDRLAIIVQLLLCGVGYSLMTVALFWAIVLNENEKKQAIALLPFKRRLPIHAKD
jgi:O-antigen/teichoic acid export membrane protein